MDGNNGGWPVLFGSTPLANSQLRMYFDEDQVRDTERRHTTEQVAYLAFGSPSSRTLAGDLPKPATESQPAVQSYFPLRVFPNPADQSTTISYTLDERAQIQIAVYDLLGRVIQVYPTEQQPEGEHQVHLSSKGLNNGMYLIIIQKDEQRYTEKLIIKH